MNNRSYAWLNIREVNQEKRIIEGIATTPVQARDGDVLETEGIQFKLPIPFLYRHREPMGNVVAAKVTSEGITVRVQVGPAGISAALDEYWNMVSNGLVRGLSIAWRTLQEAYDKEINGFRIMKSEWLELSAVPVGADPNAMITAVRSADAEDGVKDVPFQNLPIADRKTKWEEGAAKTAVRKWASSDGSGDEDKIDWEKFRGAFFWRDPNNTSKVDGYKLPFATVVDGELRAVLKGVESATQVIGIPDSERDGVKDHIARYYLKMASVFNDNKIVAPFNRSAPPPASGTGAKNKPGVAGNKPSKQKNKGISMRSFDEQITEFETELTSVREEMSTLMENSENGALTGDNATKYDDLAAQASTLRANIRRLQAHKENSEEATPAAPAPQPTPRQSAPAPRQPAQVREVEKDPAKKGIGVARMVIALIQARGNHHVAADLARQHYKDMPEVALALRAAIDAGDTTTSGWASQLVPAAQQMQSEFIDLLRPATLIGRIPGLRRVPFNIAVPLQTGGGTYNWVGEAKPKAVTKQLFDSVTLRWAKAAGIVVITRELARFSSPQAETIIRNDMVKGTSLFLDTQFIDDSVSEVSNVHPASILNGKSALTPSGSSAEAFRYDMSQLIAAFIGNNQDPTLAVLLMSATTAMNLALMRNALGQREFPDISVKGGSIDGIPVVVSQSVADRVALINADDILVADDGVINIDVSEQATIEMSTTPIGGEESPVDGAVFKSLWQNNLVGLRVETFMTWKRSRTSSVEWLDGVTYAPPAPTSPA